MPWILSGPPADWEHLFLPGGRTLWRNDDGSEHHALTLTIVFSGLKRTANNGTV